MLFPGSTETVVEASPIGKKFQSNKKRPENLDIGATASVVGLKKLVSVWFINLILLSGSRNQQQETELQLGSVLRDLWRPQEEAQCPWREPEHQHQEEGDPWDWDQQNLQPYRGPLHRGVTWPQSGLSRWLLCFRLTCPSHSQDSLEVSVKHG